MKKICRSCKWYAGNYCFHSLYKVDAEDHCRDYSSIMEDI